MVLTSLDDRGCSECGELSKRLSWRAALSSTEMALLERSYKWTRRVVSKSKLRIVGYILKISIA